LIGPVRHLHPDPGGRPQQQQGAAAVRDVPYDVGEQFRDPEFHRVGQFRHLPLVEVGADDAADVMRGVLTDGEAHPVLGGTSAQNDGGNVSVHPTRVTWRNYCRRQNGHNLFNSEFKLQRGDSTMTQINTLDPGASPLDYYGYELRRCREAAGLTQKQLGDILGYTSSLVGQIETARKVPTPEFSERADVALGTDGLLSRLLMLVMRSQLPGWFQQVAELEGRASAIYIFQPQLVHGLLQTQAYAGAVLSAVSDNALESRTAARMARQRIFEKDKPPVFWAVLSEAVLYQKIGGPEVMRAQLLKLLAYERNPRVSVQVLPYEVGVHTGLMGSFDIFHFAGDPTIVYSEDYDTGHPTANPDAVESRSLRYDHLQAAALSVRDSAELIRHVVEERYGKQLKADRRPVA
jgi:transcriptional regulator with XRE-family HTH domain